MRVLYRCEQFLIVCGLVKARTRGQIASTEFSGWFLKPKGDMKELAERTPETSRLVNFQSLKLVDFS